MLSSETSYFCSKKTPSLNTILYLNLVDCVKVSLHDEPNAGPKKRPVLSLAAGWRLGCRGGDRGLGQVMRLRVGGGEQRASA